MKSEFNIKAAIIAFVAFEMWSMLIDTVVKYFKRESFSVPTEITLILLYMVPSIILASFIFLRHKRGVINGGKETISCKSTKRGETES